MATGEVPMVNRKPKQNPPVVNLYLDPDASKDLDGSALETATDTLRHSQENQEERSLDGCPDHADPSTKLAIESVLALECDGNNSTSSQDVPGKGYITADDDVPVDAPAPLAHDGDMAKRAAVIATNAQQERAIRQSIEQDRPIIARETSGLQRPLPPLPNDVSQKIEKKSGTSWSWVPGGSRSNSSNVQTPRAGIDPKDKRISELEVKLDHCTKWYNAKCFEAQRHEKQALALRSDLSDRDANIARLKEDNQGYLHTIATQQNEIDIMQQSTTRMKDSVKEWKRSMNNQKLFLGPQADDATVLSKFSPLLSQIKTWSVNFLEGNRNYANISGEEERDCLNVVPSCTTIQQLQAKVAESRRNKRSFVRGWASYVMASMLFRTLPTSENEGSIAEDWWLPRELAHAYELIENALLSSETKLLKGEEFNDWRAFTTTLLTKAIRPDLEDSIHSRLVSPAALDNANGTVEMAARRVMKVVVPWMKSGLNPDGLKTTLMRTFSQAIECSHFLRKHRALWSIHFPVARSGQVPSQGHYRPQLRFDPTLMQDNEDGDYRDVQEMPQVQIVIGPALTKRGTSDGQRYEEVLTVYLAEVSV